MDQYRFTASGLPEQITISAFFMLVPTPSPTQPSPLYVTVNVAVVLSEDRATLAVTCEPNAFVFDALEALGEGDVALGEGDVALGEGDVALGDGDVALTFVSAICCLLNWALPPVAVVPTDTVTLDKLEMSLGAVQTNVVGAEVHRFIVLMQPFAFPPCIVPADTCTKPLLPTFVKVNVIVSEPAEKVEPLFAATKFVTVRGAEPMVVAVLVMTFVLLWLPIKSHPT